MSTNDEACVVCRVNHHAPGAPKCTISVRTGKTVDAKLAHTPIDGETDRGARLVSPGARAGVIAALAHAVETSLGDDEAATLLNAGYVPEIRWRGGSVICATGEALKNIEVEAAEKTAIANGYCLRCSVRGSKPMQPHEHGFQCGYWRTRPT